MPFFEPEDDPRRQLLPRGATTASSSFYVPFWAQQGGGCRAPAIRQTREMFVFNNQPQEFLNRSDMLHMLHNADDKTHLMEYALQLSTPNDTPDQDARTKITAFKNRIVEREHEFEERERIMQADHQRVIGDMVKQQHQPVYSPHAPSLRDARKAHIDGLHGKIQSAINEHRVQHIDDNELYNLELAAEYDASTKIFLFFLFYPFRCVNVHDSLYYGYKSSQQIFWIATKYVFALAVLIQFVFALTWLVQAQLSLSLCGDTHVALSTWNNLHITKKITGHPFTCPELLSYCKIPTLSPAQSLDSYYTARILLYIFSLVPMAIIYGKSAWRTLTLLSPIHGGGCCSGNTSNFYAATSICIVGTHLIGGIIAAIIDTGTIQYLNGLPGVNDCGTPWNTAVLDPVNFPQDAECACAAVLRPGKENGLLSMSKVEIMHPRDLAIALAVPNFVYLVWGFIFLVQAYLSRDFFKTKGVLPSRPNLHVPVKAAAAVAAPNVADYEPGNNSNPYP